LKHGIDFPDRNKLMAANYPVDEIRQYINADSLAYLSQTGMVKATGLGKESFCMACYDGDYPVRYDSKADKHIMERRRSAVSAPQDMAGGHAAPPGLEVLEGCVFCKDSAPELTAGWLKQFALVCQFPKRL
jgi:hypothetical protein